MRGSFHVGTLEGNRSRWGIREIMELIVRHLMFVVGTESGACDLWPRGGGLDCGASDPVQSGT